MLSQLFASELLFVFIMIVLASTVFTRMPRDGYTYNLTPLWSWWAAAFGNYELLKEIVLNIILFIPIGCLLPFVFHRQLLFYKALWMGAALSFIIECSQLIFLRGLFEWDDMIDNSIGAMIGCVISNQLRHCLHKIRRKNVSDRNLKSDKTKNNQTRTPL